jgi:hypothetical protein
VTVDHLTERGALLASMEWRKVYAGRYRVEGYTVNRRRVRHPTMTWWEVVEVGQQFQTFTDALKWIADQINR